MRTRTRVLICLALAAAVAGCSANKDKDKDKDKDTDKGTTKAARDIDPRADAALRRMSDALAAAKSFKLHSMATVEERTDSGQMAQFSRDSTVLFTRAGQLQADVRRGADQRRIWHEGKELTILDVPENRYVVLQTPESVDKMLDFLAEEHGIVVPLDDLLYPNPYEVLTEKVNSGVWVDQQEIGGRKCDHLLFTQDNVDWQIWIDSGEPAVPRKVVITYKDDPDQPQYEAILDQWQLNPTVDLAQFKAQVPPSAKRVEIGELVPSEQGEEQ
jgi:hypothetical protein